MVRSRRGISALGCLVSILLVVAIGYFGVQAGQVYWDFVQYQDAMRQHARFAGRKTDKEIIRALRSKADSLGLPESAQNVRIHRNARHIDIEAEYYAIVELPLFVHEVYLNPKAEGGF